MKGDYGDMSVHGIEENKAKRGKEGKGVRV